MASTGLAGTPENPIVSGASEKKISLCHRTNSVDNPYRYITVNKKSVVKEKGHSSHVAGIKNKKMKWSDVIPAFQYLDKQDNVQTYGGLGLPNGQKLLDNKCFPLALTKTGTPTVGAGGTIDYQVGVTNLGLVAVPLSAINVVDPDVVLTRPSTPPTSLAPGATAIWTGSRTISAAAEVCSTSVVNTAYLWLGFEGQYDAQAQETASRSNQVQSSPPDATSSWTTNVVCPPPPPEPPVTPTGTVTPTVTAFRPATPVLSVAKTGPARMLAGGRVAYQVSVTNTGSVNATNVVLRDQAPGVFALVAKPAGTTVSGRTIDWDLGTLTPGQSVSATVRFIARRTASGRACNVAIAFAAGIDQTRAKACTTIVAARRPATPVTG